MLPDGTEIIDNFYPPCFVLGSSDKLECSLRIGVVTGFAQGLNLCDKLTDDELNEFYSVIKATEHMWLHLSPDQRYDYNEQFVNMCH